MHMKAVVITATSIAIPLIDAINRHREGQTSMTTKSRKQADELAALLRARNPLIVIITKEEDRVEPYIFEAAAAAKYLTNTWDVAQGFADISGKVIGTPDDGYNDPGNALNLIRARAKGEQTGERTVWVFRDALPWLTGLPGAVPQRLLRNLARLLPGVPSARSQAIVLLSAGGDLPPELAAHATVIEWPLPDRDEIGGILDATIKNLPENIRTKALTNGNRDAAIDAAVGLSGEEANACYAKSLVQLGHIDPATVAQEKKRVISRERALEWHDPLPGGLSWVGGLEGVKAWIKTRSVAWSAKARAYGLPKLRGVFLTGISGCGKTLIAKAIAAALGVPLIRWDLNAARSKYVGESEGNIRRSLQTIEATGKCVVLIDEIEKALQGATSGSADGGVAADALGTVLTWMQERSSEAFVIATANDISGLPPELLRKGRFDEVFFVDLPNEVERIAVVEAALRQYKRDPAKVKVDAAAVAAVTDKWTGAEIAQLVPEAMFRAFSDGEREITTEDLIAATEGIVVLSKTAKNKINELRAWGRENARRASAEDETREPAAPA